MVKRNKVLAGVKQTSAASPADALVEKDPTSQTGRMRLTAAGTQFVVQASGCGNFELGARFLHETLTVAGGINLKGTDPVRQGTEASAFLASIGPAADAIEGALATQLWGCHLIAMRCLGQAANVSDPHWADVHLNRAAKLLRAFAQQLEALDRHRGRGRQTITIEHIGQAVIAPQGGGGKR